MYLDQEDLARRLAAGDEIVLKDLETDVWPVVSWRIRRRFAGRLRAADLADLLQESLLKLWSSRGDYKPSLGCVASWFAGIVFNCARDLAELSWAKQRRHETAAEREADELDAVASANASSGDQDGTPHDISPDLLLLRKCLAGLSERKRAILFARVAFNGRQPTYAELALEFQATPGAIRVEFHRVLAAIRKEFDQRDLQQEPDEPPADGPAEHGGTD